MTEKCTPQVPPIRVPEPMETFILPAGTVCKRNGIPFELSDATEIRTSPSVWKLIRDDFIPEICDQRLFLSQDEQSLSKPIQAAALPVMSTASSSSLASSVGDSRLTTCTGVNDVTTIQVESRQCQ